MALAIENWPIGGLRITGTLAPSDIDRLIDAVLTHPQRGASSIHMEDLSSADRDAAEFLKQRLDELWMSGEAKWIIYIHVVRGPVATVLEDAGFVEREGQQQLIYMSEDARRA